MPTISFTKKEIAWLVQKMAAIAEFNSDPDDGENDPMVDAVQRKVDLASIKYNKVKRARTKTKCTADDAYCTCHLSWPSVVNQRCAVCGLLATSTRPGSSSQRG
jgi:hypothetical protein